MKYRNEIILGVLLVISVLGMSFVTPDFLTLYNFENILSQIPEFALLTIGTMVVLVSGGIDLSITNIASLSGVVIVSMFAGGHGIVASIAIGLAVGILCGVLNGFVIAYLGVSPILVTLGTMTLFSGIAQLLTKGRTISGMPEGYQAIGNGFMGPIPYSLLILVVLVVITSILLRGTRWGRGVYMYGSNGVATLFSGVNTKSLLMRTYIFSAVMAVFAAVIMTSRYNSASFDLGNSYLLQSIAAAVLGGTSITGGVGKLSGAILGVVIFAVLADGLQLIGVPDAVVDVVMGVVLVIVVLVNYLSTRFKKPLQATTK